MKNLIVFGILFFMLFKTDAQSNKPMIGAYYFDGWSNFNDRTHFTKNLVDSFPMRKPIWGWITSTQPVMDAQINAAADAGLSFFSFCWYYNANPATDSLNRATRLFNTSQYSDRLKYCLLVANQAPFELGPDQWSNVVGKWVALFKTGSYLTVNGKPLIIFLTPQSLINKFGSVENVKKAFSDFRNAARQAGFAGVTIGACLGPGKAETSVAENCGFDILTGYNYSPIGFIKGAQQIPIENLQQSESKIWGRFHQISDLPCIPLVTLNWDPRPWRNGTNYYNRTPVYTGYSARSVYNSIKNVVNWVGQNPQYVTKERIVLLYAWNEYGEGAWLTPSSNGVNMLDGVKRALISR